MSEPMTAPQPEQPMSMVYKYKLDLNKGDDHFLPDGRVVHVGWQGEADWCPIVWVEHKLTEDGKIILLGSGNKPVVLAVRVFGTGSAMPPGMKHVGSAVCGPLVWHIYQATTAEHLSGAS